MPTEFCNQYMHQPLHTFTKNLFTFQYSGCDPSLYVMVCFWEITSTIPMCWVVQLDSFCQKKRKRWLNIGTNSLTTATGTCMLHCTSKNIVLLSAFISEFLSFFPSANFYPFVYATSTHTMQKEREKMLWPPGPLFTVAVFQLDCAKRSR